MPLRLRKKHRILLLSSWYVQIHAYTITYADTSRCIEQSLIENKFEKPW